MRPRDLARRHRFHRKRSLVQIEHHDFGHTVWDTKVDISRKHMKDFSVDHQSPIQLEEKCSIMHYE